MTSAPEMQARIAQHGDTQHAEIVAMVEYIRMATLPLLGEVDDNWPNRSGLVMTALCTYAGALFGTMIIAGIAGDQDKKRTAEMMTRNFRSGIDVGKAQSMRVAAEDVAGHA